MATKKVQRITLFVNPELLIQARAQAIIEDCTLTELVQLALVKYLPEEIIIKKPKLKEDNKD